MTSPDISFPLSAPTSGDAHRTSRTNLSGPSTTRIMLKLAGTIHRLLYQWSGGRIGGTLRGGPVLLLTTIGRRTGHERTWPVCYVVSGDVLVLAASAGGDARHPAWYFNVLAHPLVHIQVGDQTRAMVARAATGRERAQLWARFVGRYPVGAWYQRRCGREIPLVLLQPAAPTVDAEIGRTQPGRESIVSRPGCVA